jgi:hypothetical protein
MCELVVIPRPQREQCVFRVILPVKLHEDLSGKSVPVILHNLN